MLIVVRKEVLQLYLNKHQGKCSYMWRICLYCVVMYIIYIYIYILYRPLEECIEVCLQHLANTNHNPAATNTDYYDNYSSINGSENNPPGSPGGGGGSGGGNSYFHSLVKELACQHDTYMVISDIMAGVMYKSNNNESPMSLSPPGSPIQFNPDGADGNGTNEIAFTNVPSSASTLSHLRRPVSASVIISPQGEISNMKMDRDIAGYLNNSSERRIARLEAKLKK